MNKYKSQVKELEKEKIELYDEFQSKIDSLQSLADGTSPSNEQIENMKEEIISLEEKNEDLINQLSSQTQTLEEKEKEFAMKAYKNKEELILKNNEIKTLKEKIMNDEELINVFIYFCFLNSLFIYRILKNINHKYHN